MTTEADLVAAIGADYASDEPRLIYADWLLDRGDELGAEIVRLQCALVHVIGLPRTLEINRMFDRRTFLQPVIERRVEQAGLGKLGIAFERGLMQTLYSNVWGVATNAARLEERMPFFMRLVLTRHSGDKLADLATPAFAKVRDLTLDGNHRPLAAYELATVLDASRSLYELDLRHSLDAAAARVLANHPSTHQLHRLAITELDGEGMELLAESALPLERLSLVRIGGARGAKALQTATWIDRVRLHLHKRAVGVKTLERIAAQLGDRLTS